MKGDLVVESFLNYGPRSLPRFFKREDLRVWRKSRFLEHSIGRCVAGAWAQEGALSSPSTSPSQR
jgi:hypothetical protein